MFLISITRAKKNERAIERKPYVLHYATDHFKTQELYQRAIKIEPYILEYISNQYKEQEMGKKSGET